jgi:signal transduction histidine kinase
MAIPFDGDSRGFVQQSADGAEASDAPVALRDIAEDVFHGLPLGLVVFDRQMRVTHANAAAEFLVRAGESLTDALQQGAVESQYEDWTLELRRTLDGQLPKRFEHVTYHADGNRELIVNLTCSPLARGEAAEAIGGLLVVEDVTASIGMEKRLAVSERMAALGKLAARVAHELNNPLDGILRFLGLSQRVIERNEPDKAKHYLEESRSGLLRMAQIVTDLLEFSRSAHASYEDTSLNTIVEEAVKVMSDQAARTRVSIVCSFNGKLPVVRGGGNLFQVFCNIIKNAIDAMSSGGTLTISSGLTGREAVIRFDDTGPGLPEQAERVFEPFFTTKAPGKGTGLGLAICRDIVEKYRGRLTAENREQGGARFTVWIPLESCVPPRRPSSSAPPTPADPTQGESSHA